MLTSASSPELIENYQFIWRVRRRFTPGLRVPVAGQSLSERMFCGD
jgi:hypothetical protein